MIEKIQLKNFKCFSEIGIELRPLTLLCGINSCGKSSVIQAILLAMEAFENGKETGNLDLMNAKYNLDLYSFGEILYEDAADEQIDICLTEGDHSVVLKFVSEFEDNNLNFSMNKENGTSIGDRRIWYLGSERMISKYQKRGNAENLELGKENEYIAYILELGRSNRIPIDKERNIQEHDNMLFSGQVNQWLNCILPGNQVMAATEGTDNLVSLKFGRQYKLHRTNVGYGVGFVLPVIVGGLLACPGDILIIENPELHLHPKAQSNIALFLATIASQGVQVIAETHSDHIVNGVRKAVINPECGISAENTGIYYFDSENNLKFLSVNENAYLSDWPEDFMDQEEKDLYYLRKMRMINGN